MQYKTYLYTLHLILKLVLKQEDLKHGVPKLKLHYIGRKKTAKKKKQMKKYYAFLKKQYRAKERLQMLFTQPPPVALLSFVGMGRNRVIDAAVLENKAARKMLDAIVFLQQVLIIFRCSEYWNAYQGMTDDIFNIIFSYSILKFDHELEFEESTNEAIVHYAVFSPYLFFNESTQVDRQQSLAQYRQDNTADVDVTSKALLYSPLLHSGIPTKLG